MLDRRVWHACVDADADVDMIKSDGMVWRVAESRAGCSTDFELVAQARFGVWCFWAEDRSRSPVMRKIVDDAL